MLAAAARGDDAGSGAVGRAGREQGQDGARLVSAAAERAGRRRDADEGGLRCLFQVRQRCRRRERPQDRVDRRERFLQSAADRGGGEEACRSRRRIRARIDARHRNQPRRPAVPGAARRADRQSRRRAHAAQQADRQERVRHPAAELGDRRIDGGFRGKQAGRQAGRDLFPERPVRQGSARWRRRGPEEAQPAAGRGGELRPERCGYQRAGGGTQAGQSGCRRSSASSPSMPRCS